jgi:DNA-binding NtrC family response regulator
MPAIKEKPLPRATAQTSRPNIAIVTTEELVGPEAQTHLSQICDLKVLPSWGALTGLLAEQAPDAVLLDIDTVRERSDEGISAVTELRALSPELVIFAMTRSASRNLRLKAVAAGVDDYFVAPVDFDEVRVVLMRAVDKRMAELECHAAQNAGRVVQPSFAGLIGSSEAMQLVYQAIETLAQSNTTALIRGESGTGKELVARAMVAQGPRAGKPFVSINCAALPENLIETELFGHEKGAFTDARESRPGHIELAHTGTLFLDEIATLSLPLQAKLLRVLEDRAVTRIGGKNPKKIDFRLITATNEDLEDMVRTGRFREDLYYRINVVPVVLPPLRERPGDVPLLVNHFLHEHCTANNVALKVIEPDVMAILEDDPWPGNVRELENLVQRLVLMVKGPVIKAEHLPQRILYHSTATQESLLIPEGGVNFDDEIARIEEAYLQAALRRSGGKKVTAAALLHINPQKMKYLCRKYRVQG